jgi:putative phosphoesterase
VRIGLISDTHGLMRPEALAALAGVDLILHAGDVGRPTVLKELSAIAPVQAVVGNVDDPAFDLPQHLDLAFDGVRVHVSHGHELGSPTPATLAAAYDADVVVYGHTHRQLMEIVEARGRRTLVINPGAAGPRRFNLAPSVGILTIVDGSPRAELVMLE